MEAGKQFASGGQVWRIVDAIETNGIVRDLGWSHIARVSRPNGRKEYYANLCVVDGTVVNATVVL